MSTLSESPISVLFHGGMASSAMTSQREESGEVSDALFSGRKTSRQFDHGFLASKWVVIAKITFICTFDIIF